MAVGVEPTDEELVARFCTQRDDAAFTELVGRYREPVFRLTLSVLGPGYTAEAEEVAQEVFLRVHYTLPSFRGESRFGTWIYRVTFNLALNVKARARYRVPHVSYTELAEQPTDDKSDEIERRLIFSECIGELPPVYQSALRLHYWLDYSVAEIGILLAVPPNTVKSYLHRARLLLRAALEKKGIGQDV